jgi:methyl-accepting chemotaxis protein
MFSGILNQIASASQSYQVLAEQVAEFNAIKAEINKARCVIEFDTNGTITSINDNTLKALGYSSSELLTQHHKALLSRAESTSTEYQAFWDNLKKGETQTGTFKMLNKSGKPVSMQGYYAAILDTHGALRKVVSYLTDISSMSNNLQNLQNEDDALNASFGIVECDANGKILECNTIFSEPLGYTQQELVGQHISKVLGKATADSDEYKAMWVKLANGEQVKRQIKRVAKNGDEFWFQGTYAPVKNSEGKVQKVVVYSVCITAEVNRNADYEGQLKAISKIQGVIEFDLTGKILAVNENFAKVTGYDAKEIVGQHHSMFAPPEVKVSQDYKTFWENLAKGIAKDGLFKRVGKRGNEIWLQASYNPILDLNGKPFKVVKYATDVTEFKLKELENDAKVTSLDKAYGVIEFDLTGNVLDVNDNFAAVTGYSKNEIVGKHHSMFVSNEFKNSQAYKDFWAKLGSGELDSGQYHRIGKGGKDIWIEASYNPIHDMDGKPYKVIKFATDITDQINVKLGLESAVSETQHVIESAQSGDLSERVSLAGKTGDIASLCEGVNALLDKMSDVIAQISEAGETINTAANEISTGNNDLSVRTEQQASSLQNTAASMEELSSTVKQNAENAKQANQLAGAASGVAVKGGQVVGKVVTTMAGINESARKIEDIISVIDGIAFQTNILALNAAVEAARAGEQGRGFAVVAGEVRNLAQRSSSAAKEIKELISDSVGKVQEGTKLVEDAGATMTEIVNSVQRVTDIMGEITAASQEQSAGIDQVNNSVTSMDEATQQNAALVEEAAAAAESLVEQANSLMDTVSAFKLAGGSVKPTTRSHQKVNQASSKSSSERRATNSPMRNGGSSSAKPSASTGTKVSAKTGTDDHDWEEF